MSLRREAFRRPYNFYAAAALELVAPLLRAGSRAVTGAPTAPTRWRRGVILSHSHLGDVLYRTCSLPHLHARFPECRWSYLVTPSAAELLRNNPAVDEVLPLLEEGTGRLPRSAAAVLRNRFDVALCTNTFKIGADLRLAVRLHAASRVAFDFKGLSGLITWPVSPAFPSPYPEYFRQMVAAVTGTVPAGELRPRVYPDAIDDDSAQSALRALQIGNRSFVVCAPGARQKTGAAPDAYVARVLQLVAEQFAGVVVLTGSRNERAKLEGIARRAGIEPRIAAGELNVRALVSFMQRAECAIAQDSGPRHLANAAGVPVFFFRNLAVPRIETGAYCATETDLAPAAELLNSDSVSSMYAATAPERAAAAVLHGLSASARRRSHPQPRH